MNLICEHQWKDVETDEEEFAASAILVNARVKLEAFAYCRECGIPAIRLMTDDARQVLGVYESRWHAALGFQPTQWVEMQAA